MSASKNSVSLIGRVGGDPELKSTKDGAKLCVFSLATNNGYIDKKQSKWVELQPDWHRIVVWGSMAETHQRNIRKGDLIGVEGQIRMKPYKKEDVTFTTAQIVADEVLYLHKYESQRHNAAANPSGDSAGAKPPSPEDDLPF